MMHSVQFNCDMKWGEKDADLYNLPTDVVKSLEKFEYCKCVEINGIVYDLKCFIISNLESVEAEFGEIVKIMKVKDKVYFYVKL